MPIYFTCHCFNKCLINSYRKAFLTLVSKIPDSSESVDKSLIIGVGGRVEFIPYCSHDGSTSESKIFYTQDVVFVYSAQRYHLLVDNPFSGGLADGLGCKGGMISLFGDAVEYRT